ncbi:hypothetical protein WMY93_004227 [Mugilogobius chulae]|uniref:G-protein coupled receptors family 1 profile domain-containing protein n=1 Tax=Mugilogobius chulae TaxID=88201 RepID=A0AAW0PRG6_9GOBI
MHFELCPERSRLASLMQQLPLGSRGIFTDALSSTDILLPLLSLRSLASSQLPPEAHGKNKKLSLAKGMDPVAAGGTVLQPLCTLHFIPAAFEHKAAAIQLTITNFFVVSLAVADIAVGVLAIPFAIVISTGFCSNFYGCLFIACFVLVLTQSSIFSLLAIAIDRYIAIKIPLRTDLGKLQPRGQIGLRLVQSGPWHLFEKQDEV